MEFDPGAVKGEYVYVALADHVAAQIASGELQPGDRLANEREFAAQHHVAIDTGRRALDELRRRDLIRTLASKGSFVTGALRPHGEERGSELGHDR